MLKTMPARLQLLACVSLLSASACAGEPVELFPAQENNLALSDAGTPTDETDDPELPPSSCKFTAGLSPGGTPCVRKLYTHTCEAAGDVRTEISYIGCDPTTGYTGDPADSVATCEDAFAAETGVTSASELSCHRISSDDPCCIDHARGAEDLPLFLARVCVPGCANTPSAAGSTLTSCGATYAEADRTFKSTPVYGMNLIGRACEGSFMCGAELTTNPAGGDAGNFVGSYGHVVFCAHGKLQLITEGLGIRGSFVAP